MLISLEEAEEIMDDPVAQQFDGHRRWAVDFLVVFERDGEHWAFEYAAPATESQETELIYCLDTEDHFDETTKRWVCDGVKCFRVQEKPYMQWVPVPAEPVSAG